MPYTQRVEKFKHDKGNLKFKCITNTAEARRKFIETLLDRATDPRQIDQSATPLCGPAAFMYCAASEHPYDYVNYVLDLAETGEGRLGDLFVKPKSACLNAAISGHIHPVDWVALASLRDSTNKLWRMRNHNSEIAGITAGGVLADWFSATGWFYGADFTFYNPSKNASSFNHLLDMNHNNNGYICLLIRSAIVSDDSSTDTGFKKWGKSGTPKTYSGTPDHWIVVEERISIAQNEYLWSGMPNRNELINQPLRFKFWHWGDLKNKGKPCCAIDDRITNITPAQFLPYYYGYVSAAIK